MDRQHLISDSDAEIGLHILSKTTNFDYEIDQFLHELPSLFAWVRRWAWSWAYSGFGRSVLKSEHDIVLRKFCNLREYEHRLKARLENGIWAWSTEYGFVILGPAVSGASSRSLPSSLYFLSIAKLDGWGSVTCEQNVIL